MINDTDNVRTSQEFLRILSVIVYLVFFGKNKLVSDRFKIETLWILN